MNDIARRELAMLGVGWVDYENDGNENTIYVEPWLRITRLPGVLRIGTTRPFDLKCFRCGFETRFRLADLMNSPTDVVSDNAKKIIDPHRKCQRKVDDVLRSPVEVVDGHVVPSEKTDTDPSVVFALRVAAVLVPLMRKGGRR